MLNFNIQPVKQDLTEQIQYKLDRKAKLVGALGKLETLAIQIGNVQNSLEPKLEHPTIVLFAGDHGIVAEGVSPSIQDVTYQMVFNFLNGNGAINVFCIQNGIELIVVDSGVNYDFIPHPKLVNAKIAKGTRNYLYEPAMTDDECLDAINKAAEIITKIHQTGCNIIGFGEMGIGNTSSASVIMSEICGIPIEECTGPGGGLDEKGVDRKKAILAQAIANNSTDKSPFSILKTFGGFEIAMMTGAILKSAEFGMLIMIDGFISTAALLIACKINPNVLDYCIFTHFSHEKGHKMMIEYLKAEPLVNLEMRLGEGTGPAIVYPIIKSAVIGLNEMASFESAGVDDGATKLNSVYSS